MPRKKESSFKGVPAVGDSSSFAAAVALAFKALPPWAYQEVAVTGYQKKLFNESKHFYRNIGLIMDAYFKGGEPPEFEGMGKHSKELLFLEFKLLLDFYSMVFNNWKPIKKMLAANGRPPLRPALVGRQNKGGETLLIFHTAAFKDLETPMAVLLEVMRYRAIKEMRPAFCDHYEKLTAYQISKLLADEQSFDSNRTSGAEKGRLLLEEIARRESTPWTWLQTKCQIAAAGKPLDKESIFRYRRREKEFDAFLAKMNRPRNGSKVST